MYSLTDATHFAQRVAETVAWCCDRAIREDPKQSLRYDSLYPSILSETRADVVLSVLMYRPLVTEFFKARGLELSQEKTRITHIEEGFDFLGQNVRKYNGKLVIKPSRKNVGAFLDKVRSVIKANKQAKTGSLIALLNPIIRGWTHYHRHVTSSATLSKVDSAIFDCLWQWVRRRHRNKPSRWIYRKCFERLDGKRYFFRERSRDENGKPLIVRLFSCCISPDHPSHQDQG